MGILELLDEFIATFVPPLTYMGDMLGAYVNATVTTSQGTSIQVMPLSTAALSGFVMPWVNDLGGILVAIANLLDAL